MIFINLLPIPESHAVLYMGSRKEKAEIWDPLSGKRFWTKEKLKEVWHGRAIEFRFDKNSEELKSTLGKSYTTFRVACLTFNLKWHMRDFQERLSEIRLCRIPKGQGSHSE